MNRYSKIATAVVFKAPRIFPGEEHRSRSVKQDKDISTCGQHHEGDVQGNYFAVLEAIYFERPLDKDEIASYLTLELMLTLMAYVFSHNK
jgi:hypothetical protein